LHCDYFYQVVLIALRMAALAKRESQLGVETSLSMSAIVRAHLFTLWGKAKNEFRKLTLRASLRQQKRRSRVRNDCFGKCVDAFPSRALITLHR
jgi:hypothetical protein